MLDVLGGRYRLVRLLGHGASAEVWLAEDLALHREVAVKRFRVTADDPNGAARRRAEARLTAGLRHPRLVEVFDAGGFTGSSGDGWLVMEYVPGLTLGALRGDGPLAPAMVAAVGAQVADALAYVHAAGLVHRDVKPANILVTLADDPHDLHDLQVKLTDFGIARMLDGTRMTLTGTTVGTANYLSPEQVTGAVVGTASDVYALGLVLLELLTGAMAYPGHGVEAAIVRLMRPPVVPDRLGLGWYRLLTAMTAADPAARPDAAAVRSALLALLDAPSDDLPAFFADVFAVDDPLGVGADDAQRPLAGSPGRRRHTRALVGAAAALGAAAVIIPLVAGGRGPAPRADARTVPSAAASSSSSTPPHPAAPTPQVVTPARPATRPTVSKAPVATTVRAVVRTRAAAPRHAPAPPRPAGAHPPKHPKPHHGRAPHRH
ncbi:MAG: serine/threonine-protein kinase [Jatrophihabitans sp.]|uniref:serine/threonine-protein kinase n=1 Tax=Jatrophihabitans sp. TaxID=1932789 RepID=UPI003F7F87E5